jgi:DNA-binding CsgD family transcriptional regulator
MRSDDEQQRPYIFFSSETKLVSEELFPNTPNDVSVALPLSIFPGKLSGLQAIVRYLHDHDHSFSGIATLLNRSQKTIWATYNKVKDAPFEYERGGLTIPAALFATRKLSPLETIVNYLNNLDFSNAETARMLGLDPRTTWTVKQRIRKKEVEA